MNKILLVLIISSGFLLIFYANNDIFVSTRKTFFNTFSSFSLAALRSNANNRSTLDDPRQKNNLDNVPIFFDYEDINVIKPDQNRIKYIPQLNKTEYNIFLIYTKENFNLKNKFELFVKSLIKHSTVKLHLHIISDERSETSAETILRNSIEKYKKTIFYTLYDVQDCANKISDIVHVMLPYFSSNPGSYYSDALFYLSLGLHRIVDPRMRRGILIDVDVVFRSDVKELFDEFNKFASDNLFGLAPELTPVYRHILYRFRSQNPRTNFGNPYYPKSSLKSNGGGGGDGQRKRIHHGYPGLNSGVVMMNFDRIRRSRLYANNLREESVEKLVDKYSFKGHLGDQDYYTLLGYEFPGLIYELDCRWNRQLCTWWKDHGYSDIFDSYFHCEGRIKLYHGNCNTRIPE